MRGYTAAQIRAAERPLLEAGEPLMARAAAGLAGVLRRMLAETPGPLLVLAGSGDNGGDALYAAAELAADGETVWIVPVGSRIHEEARDRAVDAGAREADPAVAAELARSAAIVLDGILGIGSVGHPALRDTAREVVAALRPLNPRVVAVDLPSGIDPDTGAVPDPEVLRAEVTVTFGAMKAGLLLEPGAGYAGRVELVDVGLGLEIS
ncbi:MAG TPA: NAD(P)H-hydrate epimerase [Pseudolysinimonas sp.]|nr:NAD(P)H-hydrate epimerase [Pseudolysinimonas sp.]